MPINIEGTIQVRDEHEQVHTVDGDDFNIEDPEVEERAQGPAYLYEATYENDDANFSITIRVEEYTIGVYNYHEVTVDRCIILQNQLNVNVELD